MDLSVGKNRITGAVDSTTAGLLSGTLTLDAPDLGTLAALALVPASGRAQASIRLQPDGDRQSVAVRFNGADITWQDIAAGAIDGTMTIADAFGTPKVRGDASASAVNVGGRRLDTVKATATGEGGATRIEASARGPDIDLSTVVRLADAAVTIDTLKGTAFGTPVGSEPAGDDCARRRDDAGRRRDADAWRRLGRVEGAVSPQLDLTVMQRSSPHRSSTASPRASVQKGRSADVPGSPARRRRRSSTGRWSGPASPLRPRRSAGLPGARVNANGKSTASASSISARLSGAGLALTVDGQVPFSGPGLDVKANGTVPLALLTLSSGRELRLAGNAKVNVAVGGALAAPAVTGTVDLVDATIVDGATGFGISGASGRIDFDGRTGDDPEDFRSLPARRRRRACRLRRDRSERPAGRPHACASATAAMPTATVINTTFSGDLAVKGPLLGNGVVSGNIDLGRTEIQLSGRIGGSANAIDGAPHQRAAGLRAADTAGAARQRRRGQRAGRRRTQPGYFAYRQFRPLRARFRHRRGARRLAEGRRIDPQPAGSGRRSRCSAAAWMPSANASSSPPAR